MDGVIRHQYWTTDQNLSPFDNTEYIRKEALVEFVNKKLQESADRLDFHTNRAYAELLEYIKSM